MGKKKKAPKVSAPAPVQSVFDPVRTYTVDLGPFGSSSSTISGGTQSTTFNPSPEFRTLQSNTMSGLTGQQTNLSRPVEAQYQDIVNGNNAFYNAQAAANRANYQEQSDSLQQALNQRGLQNSTVLGAFAGQQARDANLIDAQLRAQTLESQNAVNLANAGFNSQLMNQLFNMANVPTQTANTNLFTGSNAVDQARLFNAQQQQQAAIANANLQAQYDQLAAQQRSSMMGSLIGLGGTIASAGILGPLGGLKGLAGIGGTQTANGLNLLGSGPSALSLGGPSSWVGRGVGL